MRKILKGLPSFWHLGQFQSPQDLVSAAGDSSPVPGLGFASRIQRWGVMRRSLQNNTLTSFGAFGGQLGATAVEAITLICCLTLVGIYGLRPAGGEISASFAMFLRSSTSELDSAAGGGSEGTIEDEGSLTCEALEGDCRAPIPGP